MSKNTSEEKSMASRTQNKCRFFGMLTLCCVMALVTVCLYMVRLSVITDREIRNCADAVNIFDESKASFRDTDQFTDFYNRDIRQLTEDLAITMQLETGGRFDGEKRIDIIDYFYRRNPDSVLDKFKNVHIEYKLADLLAWGRYGVQSYELDREEWNARYPDLMTEETNTAYADNWDAEYSGEIYPEDEEVISGSGQMFTVIQEEYLPADGISLYKRSYPEGGAVFQNTQMVNTEQYDLTLCDVLRDVIGDLYSNYKHYEQEERFLSGVGNMKYVLMDPDGRILKSNLRLSDSFMKRDRQQRKEALENAFSDQKAFMLYTVGTANLTSNKNNGYGDAETLASIRQYEYSFREGSTIMFCVLDEKASDDLLGNYIHTDIYGKADGNYGKMSGRLWLYVTLIVILGAASLVGFIAFTVTVPTPEKEEIKGFHKIPTLIAAGIMFVLAGLLVVPPIAMRDAYYSLSGTVKDVILLILTVSWICLFLEMLAFLYGWYSLVFRIKGQTFFSNSLFALLFVGKNSLLRKCIRLCIRILEMITGLFRNSGNILIRKILPYVCFLMINFIILAAGHMSAGSIFIGLLFDATVGVILYLEDKSFEMIRESVERIVNGDHSYQIDTSQMFDGNKLMALQVNQIGAAIDDAVQQSLKDERMKTDLITNVSHDIKTPLTSIINYVDLLKRENVEGERAQEYIRVLEEKSQRLKVLVSDLVDASKISSGNIQLNNTVFDMRELISQSLGEFEDRLSERELTVVYEKPENPANVSADSVQTWRILENLMVNVCKYAMPGSRVYVDLEQTEDGKQCLTMKNISETQLNISARELTERFVRGDVSRNTEGSGLGLSIAGDLAKLMNGSMEIHLDGDLFKVMVFLPVGVKQEEKQEEETV